MSMQSGLTQVSAVTYNTEMLGITEQTMFLLIDLREKEDHLTWHIKESINFPAANMGRDRVIPELFRFKNQADKIIIVYMNDERQGVQAANLFYEKGYENCFLLNGGIELFNEEYPHLVEGNNVPEPKSKALAEKEKLKAETTMKRKQKHQNCVTSKY